METKIYRGVKVYNTHHYESFITEKLENRLKEIKAAGYKAYIIKNPDCKLNRGSSHCGYNIWADEHWFVDNQIAEIADKMKIYCNVEMINKEYAKRLEQLTEEHQKKLETAMHNSREFEARLQNLKIRKAELV